MEKQNLTTLMMSENNDIHNTDAGAGILYERPMSGRGRSEASQVVIPRNPRHAEKQRTNWTKEMNKIVIKCFYKSDPSKRGYRKRMHKIWKEEGLFELSEQKLAGQARVIRTNGWLSEIELEEIKREIVKESTEEGEVVEVVGENEIERGIENERSDGEVYNDETVEQHVEAVNEVPAENIEERMRADGLGEEDIAIQRMLQEELTKEVIEDPISLRFYDRKRLKTTTAKVDRLIPYLAPQNLLHCNRILKASACVVMRLLGVVKKKPKKKQDPWWKKRLNGQIKTLRKDLSKLESLKTNKLKNDDIKVSLYDKYKVKKKGLSTVIEELKQRITAKAEKIKRYDSRIEQYHQNRLFQNNQKRLFERLEGIERGEDNIPDAEATNEFWRNIWEKDISHNERAEWIENVKTEVHEKIEKQNDLSITLEMLKKKLSKLSNWKSPGPDGVQGYWIKNIKSTHPILAAMFNDSLITGTVPEWLTKGRTVLIMKDKTKGTELTNYRPS